MEEEKKKRIKMDMLAIATALLLQDGPFFVLRMTLIFRYKQCWEQYFLERLTN